MAKIRESKIEKEAGEIVKQQKGYFIKLTAFKGIPDRLIILPEGRVFFVEFKRPGGKIAPLQTHFIKILNSMGFKAAILDSTEDFIKFIN